MLSNTDERAFSYTMICRLAIFGTSTDIDHTDAKSVVSVLYAVGAHHFYGPSIMDGAVEVYHFVIADAVGPMPLVAVDAVNLLDSHLLTFRRSRTMYDDLVNSSHWRLLPVRL